MSKDSVLRMAVRPEPEVEMRAVLTVAHHAVDAADAAELLDMLGLIKPQDAPARDQLCATRAAHRRLAARRSAANSGPVPGGRCPRG